MANTLLYKIPDIMQNEYWIQFLDAIRIELDIQRAEKIYPIANINDVDEATEDQLIALSLKYGYTPNRVIDETIEFLQKEILSIATRLKSKTTLKGYEIPFDLIKRLGKVFNIFYDGQKLIRAIDFDQLETDLGSYDYITPLIIEPILYYSTLIQEEGQFDTNDLQFDSDTLPWTFDSQIIQLVTKHLGIEYAINELVDVDGTNYILPSNYFEYLNIGSEYNRKTTTYPHVGCQLSIPMDISGVFNSISGDPNYSIPELELIASTTPIYDQTAKTYIPFTLDEGDTLDNGLETLDILTEVISEVPIDDFCYIQIGTGRKPLIDSAHQGIYDDQLLHLGFDEYDLPTVTDSSRNNYVGTVTGTTRRVEGIISQTVDFDGATNVNVPNVLISTGYLTYSFWVNVENDIALDQTIIDNTNIKLTLLGDANIQIEFTGQAGTLAFLEDFTSYLTKDTFIQIEIDGNNLNLYLNAVLVNTYDITTVANSFGGALTLKIGSSLTDTNYTTGIIDDLAIYQKLMTHSNREYIYENKLGSLAYMYSPVFTSVLNDNEKEEILDNYFFHSILPSNSTNRELVDIGDGIEQTFNNIARLFPIKPNTFRINYTAIGTPDVDRVVRDDGFGSLAGINSSGVIDYTTGDYTLNTFEYISSTDEVSGAQTVVNFSLETDLKPSSIYVYYTIAGITKAVNDDGVGNWNAADNVSGGSINYSTGDVNITFDTSTDSDASVKVEYLYTLFDTPIDLGEILCEYSTVDDLVITEAGVLNSEFKLLAYSTFPDVDFGNTGYYIAPQFIIDNS